ncbi:unnamed protein product [Miscanthus lutarioriparius]|uniref:Uncharacterized protein n=1 Tax=Miscanthus lutarioriparius TaxID=422564 RepID=A0A811QYY6_9POAL|nr:unnamed protein product [Miscanthus lutarioriparius]
MATMNPQADSVVKLWNVQTWLASVICRHLTHDDEVDISAVKLVRLARDCRKPLESGSKCGSWTVPLSSLVPTKETFMRVHE